METFAAAPIGPAPGFGFTVSFSPQGQGAESYAVRSQGFGFGESPQVFTFPADSPFVTTRLFGARVRVVVSGP